MIGAEEGLVCKSMDKDNRALTLTIYFELLERIFASPIAKKIANEKNINLGDLSGSGPNGRILKSDVESYTPAGMLPFADICFGSSTRGEGVLFQETSSLTLSKQR